VKWDLVTRGAFENDVPVLLLGFETEKVKLPYQGKLFRETGKLYSTEPEIIINRVKQRRQIIEKYLKEVGFTSE
jgi:hypothetical protein